MAQTMTKILMARDTTVYLLKALGFTMNYNKSILVPSQEIEFLGVIVNSRNLTFAIPQKKLVRLKEMCKALMLRESPTVRDLAKAMGRLRATAPAFSPAPLQLRNTQLLIRRALRNRASYEQTVVLDKGTHQELSWWVENLDSHNGKPISMLAPELVIASDASLDGWGAACKGERSGEMERPRNDPTHQCAGTDRGPKGNPHIHENSSGKVNPHAGGQHLYSLLPLEDGRQVEYNTERLSERNLGISPKSQNFAEFV